MRAEKNTSSPKAYLRSIALPHAVERLPCTGRGVSAADTSGWADAIKPRRARADCAATASGRILALSSRSLPCCAHPSSSPPLSPARRPRRPQTLRIGLLADPATLDPAQSVSFVDRVVMAAVCDKLIELDPKLNYVPQLATEWAWAPDGLSLTMKLRAGVVFHDGEPLDAEAVRFNFERNKTAPFAPRDRAQAGQGRHRGRPPDGAARALRAQRAADGAAGRSRRHDGFAQGRARARRPDGEGAGLRRAVPVRRVGRRRTASCSRNSTATGTRPRSAIDRAVYLPIPDDTVRLSNLRAGTFQLSERVAPSDLATVRGERG